MIRAEMKTATVAERPDLVGPGWERTRDTLPEYNDHGDVLNVYWGRLTEERPEFQFHLVDEEDRVLARVRSIPLRWNGTIEDLPTGIDGAIARGFDDGGANVLCALVTMVPRDLQSRGLSAAAVKAMREIARCHRLSSLIAPVRPSWKERYPGRRSPSPRAATTGSPADSPPSRSIARPTGAATGSRISGCITRSDQGEALCGQPHSSR
jgi:hypothetical protein